MVLVHEMTSSYDWWMTVRTAIVWNFETGRAMKAGKEPENSQLRVFSILYFLDGWLVRWSVGLQRAFWLRDKPSLLIRLVLLAGLNPDASKNGPPQSKNGTEKFTSILFSPWILKSFFIFLHLFPPSCFFLPPDSSWSFWSAATGILSGNLMPGSPLEQDLRTNACAICVAVAGHFFWVGSIWVHRCFFSISIRCELVTKPSPASADFGRISQ